MKLFVTGSGGFIGKAFFALARSRGHEVAGLERPHRLESPPWDEIRRFSPDACFHAAWIATPGEYLTSPLNADYLRWSLEFARGMRLAGTRHFVAVGTCIEYAPSDSKMSEATGSLDSRSPYAAAKNALRMALEEDARAGGMKLAWARLFYPYGPGEHPNRLPSFLVRQLRERKTVVLKTPGSMKDYIHVEDAARAFLTVVESGFSGTINIGTGNAVAIRDVAHTLARILKRPGLVCESAQPQPDEYPFVEADASKLRALGWRPHYELASGMQTLVDFLS